MNHTEIEVAGAQGFQGEQQTGLATRGDERAALAGEWVDPLAIIEARNRLLDRILAVAVQATTPAHWVSFDGKPYPTAAGAEVIARRCAVSIREVKKERLNHADEKGAYYVWVYTCTASLPGGRDALEALGTCSSRDVFLGTETRAGRPLSEVDEGNIMKAAYSNMMTNAVMRLLGLRNLTWDQLEGAGIAKGEAAAVSHEKGSRGGSGRADFLDEPLRFGKEKGKAPRDLGAAELNWYIGVWEKDLADPEKAQYHARTKSNLEAVRAMLKAKEGGAPAKAPAKAEAAQAAPQGGDAWETIKAKCAEAGLSADATKAFVKSVTGKANAKQLSAGDVAKVGAALAKRAQEQGDEEGEDL